MQGKITKGIAGFYYVSCKDGILYECKAKGVFRKDHRKPLVGDMVSMEVLDEEKHLGNITDLLERKNELIRPAVANIDQALVIFAVTAPEPNLGLLDRFLVQMEIAKVDTVICFNKIDLAEDEKRKELAFIYESAGYEVLFISAETGENVDQIREILKGKVTTVAGPSGAGKSTLINSLQSEIVMETGDISRKLERGKHTTRHSQLIFLGEDTFIFDTPGFSALDVSGLLPDELKGAFREFGQYESACKYQGCAHIHEPVCGVKEALCQGKISKERYDDYVGLYEECKNKRRY